MNYIFNFIVCFAKKVPAYNPFLGQRHTQSECKNVTVPKPKPKGRV